MYCPKCGKEAGGENQFCHYCGAKLGTEESPDPGGKQASKGRPGKQLVTGITAFGVVFVLGLLIVWGVLSSRDKGGRPVRVEEGCQKLQIGDSCIFGSYEQDNDSSNGKEEIEWIVLDKEKEDSGCTELLLVSKYTLDYQPYDKAGTGTTWETSYLRDWLNDGFAAAAFSDEERAYIDGRILVNEDDPVYRTDGGNDTEDRIFLLSLSEAEAGFSSDEERACGASEYAKAQGLYVSDQNCGWWLRSPGKNSNMAMFVDDRGSIYRQDGERYNDYVCTVWTGVRPAVWIACTEEGNAFQAEAENGTEGEALSSRRSPYLKDDIPADGFTTPDSDAECTVVDWTDYLLQDTPIRLSEMREIQEPYLVDKWAEDEAGNVVYFFVYATKEEGDTGHYVRNYFLDMEVEIDASWRGNIEDLEITYEELENKESDMTADIIEMYVPFYLGITLEECAEHMANCLVGTPQQTGGGYWWNMGKTGIELQDGVNGTLTITLYRNLSKNSPQFDGGGDEGSGNKEDFVTGAWLNDEWCVVTDPSTGLFGIFDANTKTCVIEPQYDEIDDRIGDNGWIAVCRDGYWGYINGKGETVIGFYFTHAREFINGRAMAGIRGVWGVIDETGDYTIEPLYRDICYLGDLAFFRIETTDGGFGVCDFNGNIVVEPKYLAVYCMEGYIYAEINNMNAPGWHMVYDSTGKPLFGKDSAMPGVSGVRFSDIGESDIKVAAYQGEAKTNKYGYEDTNWYGYMDKNLQPLTGELYNTAYSFNDMGYAVAKSYTRDTDTRRVDTEWVVVDETGTERWKLPKVGEGDYNYAECNGYFAIAGPTDIYGVMKGEGEYFLVNVITLESAEYRSIEFVPETACTIVQDKNTGLYGLYDGEEQIYSCVYDQIYGDTDEMIVVRGNETIQYTPKK